MPEAVVSFIENREYQKCYDTQLKLLKSYQSDIEKYARNPDIQKIEFLFERYGAAIPVEVKVGNGATVSLNEIIERFDPPYAYKFISGNVGVSGSKIYISLATTTNRPSVTW